MFTYIKASQRNRLTQSLFTTTFGICFLLVGANSIIPCPVDSRYDSETNEKLQKQEKYVNRTQQ
ncbi:unnamed protein product [Candida parapsilosis]|uniref:Uncharacterized protein n=1 Tax=Candida parapsilosis (strain CDC 317 / ATCC MYA-4646) TaxID=578454 RepID=G8B734_CANPC|nr:uncharacterized protein CPAR2_103040 [Candida parapsilosis]CAD1809616.1 unnamed protein product [Candida parapsilosis]CCE40266.1 hypothetical protein CPAR2_103040 [Candida parapsilosis]